ncbi:VPS10 domain-containing protein [Rhodothermus marinus]|uniref:VPS10 domain-containing protein n=1 Tax=Rhodothermus marinus TaxID=29549 RepID=UPI0026EAA884|nr:glycosyl hydrolase [Rhodothermus marinus]
MRKRSMLWHSSLFGLLFGLVLTTAQAQERAPVPPTPADVRLRSYQERMARVERSLVRNVPFRGIGPTIMSGRVVDVDVNPDDPTEFYVAYASGGLWKTENNGISFQPLFDREATMTIGDIAVDWAHGEVIWVGTGESNSSRSSYAGTGIYRSTDGGRTWEHLGLAETHHIGRIVIHPDDPNTVWVAAVGHLYSPNPERGIYKTTDGGRTWRRVLYVDDNTGGIDLVIDPTNPNVLYAAMWHRERRAWNFVEAGPGSGIFKSTDGGETWQRLNVEGSGFPTGEGVGRIGLALYPKNPQILYALLDNQYHRPEEEAEQPALTKEDFLEMSREAFLALSDDSLEAFLRENGFPREYTATRVKEMVRRGEIEPRALYDYLTDANQELFETPVIGAEVYRSDDGGRTWHRTHEGYLDNVYFSYGYYFGQIRVDPNDPDHVYIMGVPMLVSDDGGRTWRSIDRENVHVDHHALWVNPNRPGHLVNGNDGGVNLTYDDGRTWFKANTPPVGQFYAVAVDSARPYNVYGGLQDNGVWVGPSTYEFSYEWYAEGRYPYERLLGGDGMQVQVDPRTNDIVYTGFQFGNYFRIERKTGRRVPIKPRHKLGERPLRFNWETPIFLSRHHPDILYLGSNKLHRSFNRGDDWETISGDLTRGGRKGDVPYGTLTTIAESELRFGLIYVGSDDGLVHVTRDGGVTWTRISDELPQHLWVSHVEPSQHVESRVYVALNGYRWDDFTPYLYRSEDYGLHWTRIGTDLPYEPINVVREDPYNPDILYVGTDGGLYVSLDGGRSFMPFYEGLPHAPVHDLVIHKRARDLVVATHGRSLYVADLEEIEQLTPALLARPLHVFAIDTVRHNPNWGRIRAAWMPPDTPAVRIPYYSREAGPVTIRVLTEDDLLLAVRTDTAEVGLNYPVYDLTIDTTQVAAFNARRDEKAQVRAADNGRYYLPPGTYMVELVRGAATARGRLVVQRSRRDRFQMLPRVEPEMERYLERY